METETPTSRPSLLWLNYDCLLSIYEIIDFDDFINLAHTCRRLRFLADPTFKKHSTFEVNSQVIDKGEEYIDKLLQHIGQHVTLLVFDCMDNAHRNLSRILANVSSECKNVKKLKMSFFGPLCDVQPIYSFDNVEQLTLYGCFKTFVNFFESFHRLKNLVVGGNSIHLKTIFQNNQSIESFVHLGNDFDFDCRLLELIPNVEKLWLTTTYGSSYILELNSLLNLNRLTKLRLNCKNKNIKSFLKELATKGLIEEMHIEQVAVDDDLYDLLASFSKLQLLVLESSGFKQKLKSSIAWPAQLKKLRLSNFELWQNDLIAMIQQLECIESIDMGKCLFVNVYYTKHSNGRVSDVTTDVSPDICHIIDHSGRKQRLHVVLPRKAKPTYPEIDFIESEHLRILYQGYDSPLEIDIHFDGYDYKRM